MTIFSKLSGPRLAHGTVCVPDIDEALLMYRDLFEQRVLYRGFVTPQLAAGWCAPQVAGARMAVMAPPSGEQVFLQLIEQTDPEHYQPGTHYGWAALELSIEDADDMYQRVLRAGVEVIAPPKPLSFTDKLYPMQVRGTGGEAIYLNEVRGNLPSSDLPIARCRVDQLFIAVMGCRDMAASLDFYHALLGTTTGGEWEMPYSVINLAFGLDMTTAHKLATVSDKRTVLFEVDHYPRPATARPDGGVGLPQGVVVIGVKLPAAPVLPSGVNWLTPPAIRHNAPYAGANVGVIRGPDGELTELLWM
jgi:catechol 2,3-dioxygenase-like lactoylglutathione lyase family enzyme